MRLKDNIKEDSGDNIINDDDKRPKMSSIVILKVITKWQKIILIISKTALRKLLKTTSKMISKIINEWSCINILITNKTNLNTYTYKYLVLMCLLI